MVQEMYNEATYKWTPSQDAHDIRTLGSDPTAIKALYEKGKYYYGLPYTQKNRVTIETFDSFSPDHILTVPDNLNRIPGQDCSYSVSFAQGKYAQDMLGTDCTSRIFDRNLVTLLGGLQVKGATRASTEIINNHSEQELFEAYAELKPADTVACHCNGSAHVRMVSGYPHIVRNNDGTINGTKSYIIYTDISIALSSSTATSNNCGNKVSESDKVVEFVPNPNYTDITSLKDLIGKNTCFNTNKVIRFKDLLNTNYVPARLNVFIKGEREKTFINILNPNTLDNIKDGIKGTIYSNYPLINIKYEITNKSTGETKTITEYPEHNSGSLENRFVGIYSLYFNSKETTKEEIKRILGDSDNIEVKISATAGETEKELLHLKSNGKIRTIKEEDALKAMMDAYYNRGTSFQYCISRKTNFLAPEQATSQNMLHTVCSGFTFLTYYNALNIQLPSVINYAIAYADKYYDKNNLKTNDVIEYWRKENLGNNSYVYKDNNNEDKPIQMNLSTSKGILKYGSYLLNNVGLRPGDVIYYNHSTDSDGPGHAVLIYDLIYDDDGNVIDAITRESGGTYDKETTKIRQNEAFSGISYASVYNKSNDIYEGTIKERRLVHIYEQDATKRYPVLYQCRNMDYFTVLRPILRDANGNSLGKFYEGTYVKDSTKAIGYTCSRRTLKDFSIQDNVESRLKYEDIYIEKTVDKFNKSVVQPGEQLTYSLLIKNKSENEYEPFVVRETIPDFSEFISAKGAMVSNDEIIWNVDGLSPGEQMILKYTVRASTQKEDLGKKIVANGYVDNIATSTVENTIGYNLNGDQKAALLQAITPIISSAKSGNIEAGLSGIDVIEKAYSDALNFSFNLSDYEIEDLVKLNPKTPYWYKDNSTSSIYINNENEYADMLIPGYYGGLFVRARDENSNPTRYWMRTSEFPTYLGDRSDRAVNIYSANLQTGDVLVYKNTQTSNGTYRTEDGIYYLMYIAQEDAIEVDNEALYGFIGIDKDGSINRIYGDISTTAAATDLKVLFGKDVFSVLRPSMRMNIPDATPPEISISYSDKNLTSGPIEVYISANEEIQPIDGWTISDDKKRLSKMFYTNTHETLAISDIKGNKTQADIEITNIAKIIMPETGSNGKAMYYGISFILLSFGIFFVIFIKKKKQSG